VAEQREEGWYHDPYGLHDARWFSDGRPTKLVRDGSEESYDDPPHEPPTGRPEPIEARGRRDDLHRAGETSPPGFDRDGAVHAGEAGAVESAVPWPMNPTR
jgi:hypothetical protein